MSQDTLLICSFLLKSQIVNPIGKFPLTLSNVFAWTTKPLQYPPEKLFLNFEKLGAVIIFNLENKPIFEKGISVLIRIKNKANNSRNAFPKSENLSCVLFKFDIPALLLFSPIFACPHSPYGGLM